MGLSSIKLSRPEELALKAMGYTGIAFWCGGMLSISFGFTCRGLPKIGYPMISGMPALEASRYCFIGAKVCGVGFAVTSLLIVGSVIGAVAYRYFHRKPNAA